VPHTPPTIATNDVQQRCSRNSSHASGSAAVSCTPVSCYRPLCPHQVFNYAALFLNILQAIVDGEIKEISLDDYKGKYLVFFF
jgi:hypothetical protein